MSNAAAQLSLPFHVIIDPDLRDARRSRLARRRPRVAASSTGRRHKAVSQKSKVVTSSSNSILNSPTFGSVSVSASGSCLEHSKQRISETCICRANSFEQAGLPDGESIEGFQEKDGFGFGVTKRGVGAQSDIIEQKDRQDGGFANAEIPRSMLSPNFGSSNPETDEFWRSPSPNLDDEFHARMMSLESSHHSGSRASDLGECPPSTAAVFDVAEVGSSFNTGADLSGPSPHHGVESPGCSTASTSISTQGKDSQVLCGLGLGGVHLPSSIKKLRKKGESRASPARERGCAIKKAFSSMVYMIKAVQSHALQMRQALLSEWDVDEVLLLAHRELHSSFVWLFQTIFACTPKLMVSVMILLANFTVYSTGENVAIAIVTETPEPIALFLSTYGNPQASSNPYLAIGTQIYSNMLKDSVSTASEPDPASLGDGSGGNNYPSGLIAESYDGDAWFNSALNQRYMFSQKESIRDFHSPGSAVDEAKRKSQSKREKRQDLWKAWLDSSMQDLKPDSNELLQHVQLGQDTIRRFVAPVAVHLESDKYPCFNSTNLEYQYAINSFNPLVLANYAQFLFVVRRDNNRYVGFPDFYVRAEDYFHWAMPADPLDSTFLGRFASFLWLRRGNRSADKRGFKAAIAADPDNSFPASNYANFLWQFGEEGTSESLAS